MSFRNAWNCPNNLHNPCYMALFNARAGNKICNEGHWVEKITQCSLLIVWGCDFQSYNQINNWMNISLCTAYFWVNGARIVLYVYAAHACSFNYKSDYSIMLCVYCSCMSEWSVAMHARLLMTLIHM